VNRLAIEQVLRWTVTIQLYRMAAIARRSSAESTIAR
jgi:hypothetical protein